VGIAEEYPQHLETRRKPIIKQQILQMMQFPFIRWKDNQDIICTLNNGKVLSTSQGKKPSQNDPGGKWFSPNLYFFSKDLEFSCDSFGKVSKVNGMTPKPLHQR
jgi:hypothetical protein